MTAVLKRAWIWLLRALGWLPPDPPDDTPPKDIYPLW